MPLLPLILAVALFMEQIDSTVIATSLPAIAADLGTSPVTLKLAVMSYLVALAIFIPISGWMADRFGARNVFRVAIGVFVLGSIACALSGSIHAFVIARFVQGMGGSMMTPVSRLLLVRGTPRNELVGAMAWLTIPALVGPILGPPLGGFITTYATWHWIFLINVPIGIVGIILVSRYLPAGETVEPRPIDAVGFLLSGVAFSGFVFGLSVMSLPALPIAWGYAAVASGIVAGGVYLWHARRTPYPLLDPAMMRYPLFRSAIIGGSLFRIGIGAIPFLLPLMLQLGFGLSPFQSGLITFVGAVGALFSKFGVQWIYRTFGFRNVFVVGAVGSAALIGVNALFFPDTPKSLIMLCLLVGGILRSISFTGVNALVFSDIEDRDSAQATTINAVFQQVSLAVGVALAGGILDLAARVHGGPLRLEDFHIAFVVVAIVASLSAIVFLRLPSDAGSAVSGHRRMPSRA
ncbi:EmrB/QacA subfamily drug resistance transporter [Amaricoccus macauensis]|uniref:EmrB/QacA subfamily drug resistance transporter n=1 Tax=Amaricoccus macauensis TaxID=57001 RepID=A0A840SUV8_9RHOB|nr:MFS transporter [Amaricoccus macauensis]MBB5222931.1 EmrB/QacA subfamily drug resistance transporter [Amaricoccus macauensis]